MPPPRMHVCYLCGQQFGSASLSIHQQQCYKKKVAQWEILPPGQRGPMPQNPAAARASMEAAKQHRQPARGQHGGKGQDAGRVCGGCGAPADSTAKFCQECGSSLVSSGPTQRSTTSQRTQSAYEIDTANAEAMNMFLKPCSLCGRKFAPDRVQRHEQACRVANKPRKRFDSHRHRVEGTDMARCQQTYRREVAGSAAPRRASTHWRQKHREFISAVRSARGMQSYQKRGGNLADLPPPPPSANPDYVQCPYCSRRFAPSTAERHIPKCQHTVNKPRPPPGSMTHRSSLPTASMSGRAVQYGSSSARQPLGRSRSSGASTRGPGVLHKGSPMRTMATGRATGGGGGPDPFSNEQTWDFRSQGRASGTRPMATHSTTAQAAVTARPRNTVTTTRGGGGGFGDAPDPRSNEQTFDIFSGRPRQHTPPPMQHDTFPSHNVDPKSNVQTMNIFAGGGAPAPHRLPRGAQPHGTMSNEFSGRGNYNPGGLRRTNETSSAMYQAFGR